jgi:DNA-directed RNA polymerase subunit RPC12/RpoP
MPRFHRNRPGFGYRGGNTLQGAIWLIGIGVLMLWGHWWPGILVLIGLSIIMKAAFSGSAPQTFDMPERPVPPAPTPPPAPVQRPMTMPTPQVTVTNTMPKTELLPATCPRCGAPVRSFEVKWTGSQSAVCAYCGSNLLMKKS